MPLALVHKALTATLYIAIHHPQSASPTTSEPLHALPQSPQPITRQHKATISPKALVSTVKNPKYATSPCTAGLPLVMANCTDSTRCKSTENHASQASRIDLRMNKLRM